MFVSSGEIFEITITSGMSAREAALAIKDAGIVGDSNKLIKWMVKYGIDRSLKPGIYRLYKGDAISVARQLKNSNPKNVTVTLIPGTRYKSIVHAVGKEEGQSDVLDMELADNENYPEEIRQILPDNPRDRIIFLLPETYFLSPGDNIEKQLVIRSSKLWFERIGNDISKNINKNYLLSRGTLASVIETESKIEEERPILAGIFLKRIEYGMPLQSCATVIYCWEERGEKKKSLSYKDLEIDSPYNTYTNKGLPPGPISIPSQSSWLSALNPQKSDYLFFFATPQGNHIFSSNYQEHLSRQKEVNQ